MKILGALLNDYNKIYILNSMYLDSGVFLLNVG